MVVQHNLTAMNSNRMLGLTTKSQAKSTEKLSSGYKINRAADDAAGLAISEKMRKQIRGLTQASLNAQDGISAVQIAEGALTEVHDMLQRMNELATKAANGTNSEEERQYIQSEVDALIDEIDRVAETTKFNELYLLNGDPDAKGAAVEQKVTMNSATAKAQTESTITTKAGQNAYAKGATTPVTASSGATAGSAAKMELNAAKIAALATGEKFYASTDGTNNSWVEVTAGNLDTYFQVDDAGTVTAKTGVQVKTGTDVLVQNGAGTTATLTDYVTGTPKADAAPAVTGNLDQYVEVDANGQLKYKDGAMLYTEPADASGAYGEQLEDTKITDLTQYFEVKSNAIRTGNAVTDDAYTDDMVSTYFDKYGVYQGGLYLDDGTGNMKEIGAEQIGNYFDMSPVGATSLLQFKLQVGADGTDRNMIEVKIESMSAAGIGVDKLAKVGVLTQDDARATIESLKEAIKIVSQQRSDLGAVQNRLEHTINNLDNIVENTTSAESQIRDTDMATEMVKYSNNNILAQAGQAMLAQANQSNQGVLSLLG